MIKINFLEDLFYKANTGSQPKWIINNIWYKADDFNHEGLAETICSDMLKKSNVERFAIYDPELIQYRGKTLTGRQIAVIYFTRLKGTNTVILFISDYFARTVKC